MRQSLAILAVLLLAAAGIVLSGGAASAASGPPAFVQVGSLSGSGNSVQGTLAGAVGQGDLLVGWFSEYDSATTMKVSDNVNGAWTQAPGQLAFTNDAGVIGLFYRENSAAAGVGALKITATLGSGATASINGAVAEYSGVAFAGALDQVAYGRDISASTAIDTGPTPAVGAGDLVYSAVILGGSGSFTPGTGYTARTSVTGTSTFEQDILSSAAGPQDGTASLSPGGDWYAVAAAFKPYPTTPPTAPGIPAGLALTSNSTSRVGLSWSPSSGSPAGYTVYRNGAAVGTTGPNTTTFLDSGRSPSTAYTYTVDAFDLANDHSAQSAPLAVTTPATSPSFVQGYSTSTGTPFATQTFTFSSVAKGDLLVGWFGQFAATGQVQVSDSIDGSWTRVAGETFSSGGGDIGLYYTVASTAGSPTVTVAATTATYLQFAAADFRDGGKGWSLDTYALGTGAAAQPPTLGPTSAIAAGDLVVGSFLSGGQPEWATVGSSQNVPYAMDVANGSTSADLADILSSAAGTQGGTFTVGNAFDWYTAIAAFAPSTEPPTITSLSSTSGPFTGAQTLTVSGRSFAPGATVSFGPNPATNVTYVNSTQLTVTTPPGVGKVNVTVTNPGGVSTTATGAYTYNPAPDVSYFSWFDRVSSPGFLNDNVHVVNPGATAANVVVDIPGNPGCMPHGTIPAHAEEYFTCATGFGGPVTVNSDQPVLASQRVQYYQSFNEVNAQSAADAATTLYFSWFDRVSNPGFLNDNVHVVDPGATAATVSVSLPGCSAQQGSVPAGGEEYFTCAKGIGGPVKVTSDQPVLASQRVQYYQTFNEVNAQSAADAATALYFSWFDRVSSPGFLNDNVHVVDPGGTAATVSVSIPGCSVQHGSVPAGGEEYFSCAKGIGGPVKVTSDQPVLASQRVQYYQSFNEVNAQSAADAATTLYFSWFDRVSNPGFLNDNVHVVNPGGTAATVSVSIPGCSAQQGSVPAGGEEYFTCAKGIGGPVTVTSNQAVLASQRVQYYQSFNEVLGQAP